MHPRVPAQGLVEVEVGIAGARGNELKLAVTRCCCIGWRAHYGLDERLTQAMQADWLLGAFLMLRREMLDERGGFDEGFRLYGEDIDLLTGQRSQVGSAGMSQPPRSPCAPGRNGQGVLTKQTLWHWRSIARFVRKHPERLRAL